MYGEEVIREFIQLRVNGKTLLQCEKKLSVSKPTLVKWNQKYKKLIQKRKNLEALKFYAKRLTENEDSILIHAKNIRWIRKTVYPEERKNTDTLFILRDLEKAIGKEIISVKLGYSKKTEEINEIEITFKK